MTAEPHYPEFNLEALKAFEIKSVPTIAQLLEQVLSEENELYVYTDMGNLHFVSEILGLETTEDNQQVLWVATPYDKGLLKNLDPESGFVIVTFPAGVKLQFSGKGMEFGEYSGIRALRLPIPDCVYRMQRRNHFRVLADEELMVHLKVAEPKLKGDFELVDLSIAGCGVSIEGTVQQYAVGQQFTSCQLFLPDGESEIEVGLVVRNIQTNPEDAQHVCLGCTMELQDKTDEYRLQRFLLATERRQRARQALFSR